MWNAVITYDDLGNFMSDKTLFTAAVQSAITYLNQFIVGSTTLNVTVSVSATSTGRFAGNGAIALDHTENGLNYLIGEAARELAAGTNLNGDAYRRRQQSTGRVCRRPDERPVLLPGPPLPDEST